MPLIFVDYAEIESKYVCEEYKDISRNYSKVDNHWQETIVTREIPASKVPEDILARANEIGYGQELDITDELEMQLESA